ncbi:MAG TPA: FecR domain-containing protein, partial [Polyangiales bacterium]|nr:FecR domain-containing protein [Polyangiales bacterium]
MTRSILIALAVVIAVFGAGLVLRDYMFSERAQPVLIPGAAGGGEVVRPAQLTVRTVEGHVERRGAEGEQWQPLAPNASVSEADSVRTDEGARAVLSAGEGGMEIELAEQSELAMKEIKHDQARVVVERGRLSAAMGKGATKLSVGARDNDAVVEAKQGAFAVLRDGDGQVAVAVTEGDVAVTAQQTRVQVGAGEQSIVAKNQPPAKPTRIPTSLFLKVSRSGPARVNQHSTELAGVTSPGAAVFVNGTPVTTDATGAFKAKVALQEGKNQLQVTVRDAMGRNRQEQLADVTVDTQPPKL